jgi:hypothetical protein
LLYAAGMFSSAQIGRPATVLIVAAPHSDWAPVAERHTHEDKDVVVLFAHEDTAQFARTVRERIAALASNGTALVALASVGILEMNALRALARVAGIPVV